MQAVGYDIAGHSASSQVVRIGKIEDTVRPKLRVLKPFNREILTTAETVLSAVSIEDIGDEAERSVTQTWYREYQTDNGEYAVLAQFNGNLFKDEARDESTTSLPLSEPDNHYYIYWAKVTEGSILQRTTARNERVRIVTTVTTQSHEVSEETIYEIGLPIAESRFWSATATPSSSDESVYFSSIQRYQSNTREGAMVGAWSVHSPFLPEGITTDPWAALYTGYTGIFLADAVDETEPTSDGKRYIFSSLLNGAAEIFRGTITDIHADGDFVLASKASSPCLTECDEQSVYVNKLRGTIASNSDTGTVYEEEGAELLLFSKRNEEGEFGLPYMLSGRFSLPYPEALGVARKDNLAFIANGRGGVQVVDISDLNAPYRVAYIKPNGEARDVLVDGDYAYIAAGLEGVVVVDIKDPAMPIVGRVDTFGIANRMAKQGNQLWVANLAHNSLGATGAEVTAIDVTNPLGPVVQTSLELTPNRGDRNNAGVFDVSIIGNKVYANVYYVDEEGKATDGIIEIIDTAAIDSGDDFTVPVVTHRPASEKLPGGRDLLVARGQLHTAGGQQGLQAIDFPVLTVIGHTPVADSIQISTDTAKIEVELSAALDPAVVLGDYFAVYKGFTQAGAEVIMGEDVSSEFTIHFATRNDQPHHRIVELVSNSELAQNSTYIVEVKKGLQPLTGYGLVNDYRFEFSTVVIAGTEAPVYHSITPNTGDIAGGTQVVIRGEHLGNTPQVYLGGQLINVLTVEAATPEDPHEKIIARTVPNYAGPAALTVINDARLSTNAIGVFTYIDQLQLSFVTPGVVDVSQRGENDQVDIIGYGFNPEITLRAYPTGSREQWVSDSVDDDRLVLHSAERMSWTTADFGSYRGFVDLEIEDQRGEVAILPRALFYGQLSFDRQIPTAARAGNYIPDPGTLPPGNIIDLFVDSSRQLIYVLGEAKDSSQARATMFSRDQIQSSMAPAWMSLISYDRNDLSNAAPMHQLGYYNLPQDVTARGFWLSETHVYVSVIGEHFPNVETDYEDKTWLFIYDRETRDPDSVSEKDRGIIAQLPMPFVKAPSFILGRDNFLIVASRDEGVALFDISVPTAPQMVARVTDVVINGTVEQPKIVDLSLRNSQLHWVQQTNGFSGYSYARVILDLTEPTLAQIAQYGHDPFTDNTLTNDIVTAKQPQSLALWTQTNSDNLINLGNWSANGFDLRGGNYSLMAQGTLAVSHLNFQTQYECENYWPIFDVSRADNIYLLDVISSNCSSYRAMPEGSSNKQTLLSDDGILLTVENGLDSNSYNSRLTLTDVLTLDLVDTQPLAGDKQVSTDTILTLTFNKPLAIPVNETEQSYLETYLKLVEENGSDEGIEKAFSISIDQADLKKSLLHRHSL